MNIKNLLVGTCLAYNSTDRAPANFRGTTIHPSILNAQTTCLEAHKAWNEEPRSSAKKIGLMAVFRFAELDLTIVKEGVRIDESEARMPGISIVTGGFAAGFIRLVTLVNNDRKIKENKIAEKTHAQFEKVMTELKTTVKKID